MARAPREVKMAMAEARFQAEGVVASMQIQALLDQVEVVAGEILVLAVLVLIGGFAGSVRSARSSGTSQS